MNVERRSLPEELRETQRIRSEYLPLRINRAWEKIIEKATDTGLKKIGGVVGVGAVTAASIVIDGNIGVGIAEASGLLSGATIGEEVPFISWPKKFIRRKKALKAVREERDVSVEEIAKLLLDYPNDIVVKEEVKLWPRKQLGEETLEHPERYRIMKAVLNNNPEAQEKVVEKFMQAQVMAQEIRRSKEYMRKEALEKTAEIIISVAVMSGGVSAIGFLLGYPRWATVFGGLDDAVGIVILAICFSKERIKSFFRS